MRTLGVITARGASDRMPAKNISDLGGKPLIAWSIDVGLATCDAVVTSTDSIMIADVAMKCGGGVVMRPDNLAHGQPGMQMKSVLHAYQHMKVSHGEFDAILLLQPTSPFRDERDVVASLKMLDEFEADSVVSVVEFPAKNTVFTLGHAGRLRDVTDRLKDPTGRAFESKVYSCNGAIYLARANHLLEGGDWYGSRAYAYVMPPERSIDIDTHSDLDAARNMLNIMQEESLVLCRQDS